MQLFRTLCVVAVLGALTYGAYVTLTSSPPVPPPTDMVNITSPPRIELPGAGAPTVSLPTAAASGTAAAPPVSGAAPKFAAAPQLEPPPAKPPIGGATITGIRPQENPLAAAPVSYPSTNIPPGPFDGVGSSPLGGAAPPSAPAGGAATPNSTTPPGTSISTVAATPVAPAAPPLTPVTPVAAANPQPGTASAILATADPNGRGLAPSGSAAAALAEAQTLLQQNQFAAALEKLSAQFDNAAISPDDDRRVMELLDQLAGTVIYSREHLLLPAHTVRPGERLDQVAAQYKTSWELLAKINGLTDPWNVPPGTQLKVVPGPFDALVDKSRRRLSVFLDGMYAGSFPIGFGRDRPALDGQYFVNGKTPNPAYVGPDLQLPADDPNNPLGERLLDLGNGQAIHGTSEPSNLANDDARGCIRLSARDSEDVYDILTPGSQVIIRP